MKKILYIAIIALSLWVDSARGDAAASHQEILIGPYIERVDQQSAVVAFELATPSTATVTVEAEAGSLAYQSKISQTLHLVTVDGLRPGQAYSYTISVPSFDLGEQGKGLIKTASLPGESFSFTVIGDTRPGENRVTVHHARLAEQIAALDPAFSLVLGDLVDDGSNLADWRGFFDVEKEVLKRAALFPVHGDNDYANGKGYMPRYFPRLAKGYYSFKWGSVYFFALSTWDTKGRQPTSEFDKSSEQYRWLASELAKQEVQEAPFRVVFLHDPVFISRGRASRLLQETLAPLFERSRVDLVFSSWHLYERSQVKRVNYIISGGGGAELIWSTPNPNFKTIAEAKRYHFCRVDVGAGGLMLRAVAEDGTVLDQIALATNVGDDSREEELSRFAGRMATIDTYGEKGDTVVPVYVFNAQEAPFKLSSSLVEELSPLKSQIMVYSFNLRKRAVFDLLLHAQGVTGTQPNRLPAIFVGENYLSDSKELSDALRKSTPSQNGDLFSQKSNLREVRAAAFRSLDVASIALNGFLRALTVGGLLWLGGFGLLLFLLARRGGRAMIVGWVVIGAGFLLGMVSGIFYFDIVKMVPSPDLFATLLGLRENNLVFFNIQAMINEPDSRGLGLAYLAMRTSASYLPSVVVMFCVPWFVRRKSQQGSLKR